MPNPADQEILDIVDENDNVLSQATRGEAHARGLLHRTVISEVKNTKGEWLLVRQSSMRQDPGQYVSPVGGHVEGGETEEEALKREALEEVGFKDFDCRLVGKAIFRRNVLERDENHYFIMYEIVSDQELIPCDEWVDCKAFTTEALKTALRETPELFGKAFHFVVKTFYPELLQ